MNRHAGPRHIGHVAVQVGLSSRAIRYYEERGLIRPARTEGGFRLYSPHDIDLLRTILHFRELGMSLEEIRAILAAPAADVPHETTQRLREALRLRREEFARKIDRYREGIEQVDRALDLLAACTSCGAVSERLTCDACVRSRGGEVPPLLDALLENRSHG